MNVHNVPPRVAQTKTE